MPRFEVRTGHQHEWTVEAVRFSRKDAELDVELLAMFGKRAWIVEVR